MFELEIERTKKRLRQIVTSQQPYVTLQSIVENPNVHAAFRVYFQAEVQWWLHEEQAIRAGNPRFDTSANDVRELGQHLDGLYGKHARFDHEELEACIDAAVKTRLNMVCRPRTTLKWFVFRGEPTRTIREILLRLDYLVDYKYVIDGLRTWASSRGPEASLYEILSVVEFERIVEKIDNDAILELSQGQFVALLDAMYAFFADANPDLPPECVPTEAVIIFLDDKGAIPISQALERLLYREELTFVTRTKLLEVIDLVLATFEVLDPPLESQIHEVPLESTVDEREPEFHEESPVVQENPPDSVEVASEPLETSLESEIEAILEPQNTVQASTPATLELIPSDSPIPTAESNDGSVPPSQGAMVDVVEERFARLLAVMDDRMVDKVVKKVFVRNKQLFDETMRVIFATPTWKDAVGALDRFYAENDVEANSAIAMELSLAIRQSYRS